MLNWNQLCDEFRWDGSWRDIVVPETNISHWQQALDALRSSSFTLRYLRDGVESSLPFYAAQAFPAPGMADRLFSVNVGGPILNSHFFLETEIEFDLDPREVQSQVELEGIVRFMRLLADATGRDAVLTPENMNHIHVLCVRPNDPRVEHRPFGGLA
jgi:hypothetical protein